MEALLILTLLSVGLFLLGIPIVLAFAVWVIGFSFINPVLPYTNLSIGAYDTLDSFPFVAIPLFIAVGTLINETDISRDIIAFFRSFGGKVPGATANISIYTAGTLAAITGSNAATTATVGEALHSELVEEGYAPEMSAATIAAGGTLGVIIPPSVMAIIYGITFNVSVVNLFIAGIVPGLAMLLSLSAVSIFLSYRHQYGITSDIESPLSILRKFWNAKAGLGAIIVLIGGIYIGLFTPTEASVAGFAYILFVGVVSRDITDHRAIFRSLYSAGLLTSLITPLLVVAIAVQQGLSFFRLQTVVADAVLALPNRWAVMFGIIIVILLAGTVLNTLPNLILVAPLLAPAADSIGLSPLMWGILFLMGDAIGFITPPYGINLYVISGITGIDYITVARAALPYLGVLIAVWVTFFIFPSLNFLAPI